MIQYNEAGRAIPRTAFVYDPVVRGLDSTFWKSVTGTPSLTSNRLRVNNARLTSFTQYMRGKIEFKLNVPTAPSGGDDKFWGLRNPVAATFGAIYFQITGAVFQAVSYDDAGNAQTTAITWDTSTWDGNQISYQILWTPTNITFLVNGIVQATHQTRIGTVPLALDIDNNDADNLDTDYVFVRAADLAI